MDMPAHAAQSDRITRCARALDWMRYERGNPHLTMADAAGFLAAFDAQDEPTQRSPGSRKALALALLEPDHPAWLTWKTEAAGNRWYKDWLWSHTDDYDVIYDDDFGDDDCYPWTDHGLFGPIEDLHVDGEGHSGSLGPPRGSCGMRRVEIFD